MSSQQVRTLTAPRHPRTWLGISRRGAPWLLAVCLALGAAAAERSKSDIEELFLRVRRSLGTGELERAESDARRILGFALERVGAISTALGQLPEGERAYLEACRMFPLDPQSCLGLASVSLRNGRYDVGKKWARRLLELDPLQHEARHALGSILFMEGDYDGAADELRTAYALRPTNVGVAYTLGLAYLQLERLQDARDIFAEVLAALGDSAALRVFFGRAYRETGYLALAAAELRKAIDLDPGTKRAHYYLGLTSLLQHGSRAIPEAIPLFEAERRINPDHDLSRRFLEVLGSEPGQREEALSALLARAVDETLVLEEDPLDSETRRSLTDSARAYRRQVARAYKELALAYAGRGEASAAAYAAKADWWAGSQAIPPSDQRPLAPRSKGARVEADPADGSVRTLRLRARRALEAKDTGAAWDHASRARKLAPASPDVLADFADASLAHGMVADAVFALRLLLVMKEDHREHLLTLGTALIRAGDFPAAIETLSRYSRLQPADSRSQLALGVATYLAGEDTEAAGHLRAALDLQPTLPDAHFYLAEIAHRRGAHGQAKAHLQTALEQAGEHPRARVALAKILSREGRDREALQQLERAVAILPRDSEVQFQLGNVYSRMGDRDKAERHLELYSRYKRQESADRDRGRQIQHAGGVR
jgi:protein O-GlcNAc transferase